MFRPLFYYCRILVLRTTLNLWFWKHLFRPFLFAFNVEYKSYFLSFGRGWLRTLMIPNNLSDVDFSQIIIPKKVS